MEHLTAIKVIEALATDINLSQDPKGVLTKYATAKNLTPAELERLGQVYNSAKTLSHLEKSANRGSTYSLLDIEDLVNGFTKHEDKVVVEKSASVIVRGGKIPNLFEVETLTKEASSDKSEFLEGLSRKLKEQDIMEKKAFLYNLQANAEELKVDIRNRTKELVKKAFYANQDFNILTNILVSDSAASPNGNKDAIEFLAKKAGELTGTDIRVDFTKAASVKVVTDRTGFLKELEYVQEEIDLLHDITELQKSSNIFAGMYGNTAEEEEKKEGKKVSSEELEQAEMDLGLPREPKQLELPLLYNTDIDITSPKTSPPPATPDKPADAPQGAPTEERSTTPDSILAYLMAKRDAKNTEVPEQAKEKPNTAALDSIKALIDSKFDNLISPHLKPTPKIRGYENAGVDKQVSSVQTAATIHELMQDPIISAHSPQKVVSLYNSLAQINPAMMRDKNVSKFALREALQYEGITPHTYGQLIGIEKDKAQTEKQKLDIRKELYGKV